MIPDSDPNHRLWFWGVANVFSKCGFQDPFEKIPSEFQQKLSEEERRGLKGFLSVTDVEAFALELHEILLLKTTNAVSDGRYQPHWE